jgi:hypothetical protein
MNDVKIIIDYFEMIVMFFSQKREKFFRHEECQKVSKIIIIIKKQFITRLGRLTQIKHPPMTIDVVTHSPGPLASLQGFTFMNAELIESRVERI